MRDDRTRGRFFVACVDPRLSSTWRVLTGRISLTSVLSFEFYLTNTDTTLRPCVPMASLVFIPRTVGDNGMAFVILRRSVKCLSTRNANTIVYVQMHPPCSSSRHLRKQAITEVSLRSSDRSIIIEAHTVTLSQTRNNLSNRLHNRILRKRRIVNVATDGVVFLPLGRNPLELIARHTKLNQRP